MKPATLAIAMTVVMLCSSLPAAELPGTVMDRARKSLTEAAAEPVADDRDRIRQTAREQFQQAYQLYVAEEAAAELRLKAFASFIDPEDVRQIEARDEARSNSIQSQLFTAAALFESAQAYDRGSAEATKRLQDAADKFGLIYGRFRTRLAGHLARVKQGQCHQELGDTRSALGYYAAILQQPDDITALRPLKATAMRLSLECWTGPIENRNELAVQEGENFLANTQKTEARQADFLAIYYYTALGFHQYHKTLRPEEAAQQGEGLARAVQHAQHVADHAGEFQDPAKKLLTALREAEAK